MVQLEAQKCNYICPRCTVEFTAPVHHLRKYCDGCGILSRRGAFSRRQRTPTQKRNYICSRCAVEFIALVHHFRKYCDKCRGLSRRQGAPTRNYICSQCMVKFIAPIHNRRKYCDKCSAAIRRKGSSRRLDGTLYPSNVIQNPNPVKTYICARCSEEFIAPVHNYRKFCDPCKPLAGTEWRRLYRRKYRQTEVGKLAKLKSQYRRMGRHADLDVYIERSRVVKLHKEPCKKCSVSYIPTIRGKPGHQLDHILALCNGGEDVEGNYQVLCFPCHTSKSKIDRQLWNQNKTTPVP